MNTIWVNYYKNDIVAKSTMSFFVILTYLEKCQLTLHHLLVSRFFHTIEFMLLLRHEHDGIQPTFA